MTTDLLLGHYVSILYALAVAALRRHALRSLGDAGISVGIAAVICTAALGMAVLSRSACS
jgi:hypothetical protein